MKKIPTILLILFFLVGYAGHLAAQEVSDTAQDSGNSFAEFLRNIKYTSRLSLQYDDNIFLTEDNEDSDLKQIFTQALEQNFSKGNHFLRWAYIGNYEYFDQESLGVLGHTASALYSYRPFDQFSFGIGNTFNWLQDSAISAPLGDRLLALGYTQISPVVSVKYEADPRLTLLADINFQDLDVRDGNNDDYIDNERFLGRGQIQYALTEDNNLLGSFGYEHDRIIFPQISEKSATSGRPFVALTKKFPGLFHVNFETGFENIRMDDNADDDNIDYRLSLETVFSVFTKFKMGYQYNSKTSSLRREYTQYGSNVAFLRIDHTINPLTSVYLGYTHETQDFNSSDALIGQTQIDRQTYIQGLGVGFNRKLNQWLTWNLNYDYTKRDTDFAQEGYTDNKYTTSLTARY